MVDLLGWAERFIATPSVSRDGNGAVAKVASDLLREIGLEPRWQTARIDGVEHHNVIADVGPQESDGLLLVTHLDTVPPGAPARWTATGGNPFRPTHDGDLLYGLGSADVKVDFASKALALAEIDRRALRRRVRIVGTFAEEIGLLGARHFVESGEARGFRWALVGEPSELVAIRAHKGYSVFEARVRLSPARLNKEASGGVDKEAFEGESAHSSTPELGTNAIELALERLAEADVVGIWSIRGGGAVNQVPEACELVLSTRNEGAEPGPPPPESGAPLDPAPLVAFHRAWRELLASLEERRNDDFDPDHTVGNLGRIEIDGPDAVIGFDLRPVPEVDPTRSIEPLEAHAKIRCVRSNPSLRTPEDSSLVRAILAAQAELGIEPAVSTKATCTEAGVLAGTGLETVVLGAGRSVGNVHRPNEHTRITEIYGVKEIYTRVIRSLCVEEDACFS